MPLPALRGKMEGKRKTSGEKRCWQSCAETAQALEILIIRRQQLKRHFAMAIFSMTSSVKWHGHSPGRRRIQVIN
jgi:hypothetical protein